MLELVRRNVIEENLPLHLLPVFFEEGFDVRTCMQNIVSVVCQDKREVRAPEQCIEKRTRMDAFAQIFLDENAEENAGNKCREGD